MVDIVHRIAIKAPASEVYTALSTIEGVAGWWTRSVTGDPRIGASIVFRFQSPSGAELGAVHVDVLEASPDDRVRWRVRAGPAEWVGTDIEFSLAAYEGGTIVLFGHRRWREEVEFTAHCSMKWATFLLSACATSSRPVQAVPHPTT